MLVISAGGTFEKHYDEISGELVFTESHADALLKQARVYSGVETKTLFLVDSLEMTEEQRKIVADECKKTSEKQIVVIHGTDTMAETAAVVAGSCTGKTVVLTGAMVPVEFGNSDAFFNFGFALSAARTLPAGVYVAMNGNVFPWDDVRKDRVRGVFETKQ